jgi:hypothetical protein
VRYNARMNEQHLYRACAYHEAGHAVVAHILGLKLRHVLIREDLHGETARLPSAAQDVDLLTVLEAGAIAQEKFDPESITLAEGTLAGTLADDMRRMIELMGAPSPDVIGRRGNIREPDDR